MLFQPVLNGIRHFEKSYLKALAPVISNMLGMGDLYKYNFNFCITEYFIFVTVISTNNAIKEF